MPVVMVFASVDQIQIKVFATLNPLTISEIIRVFVDIYQFRPRYDCMAVDHAQTVPKVLKFATSWGSFHLHFET